MEKIYHYLWKSKMFGRKLTDDRGNAVEVIDPGCHNLDSGPDFFNSKVKIGDTEWVGNVEIHVKASDWYRHGHHNDPAYDNVVLHVVSVADKEVRRSDGSLIPQVVITFPELFFRRLQVLSEDIDAVRCSSFISSFPRLNITDWLETLSVERIQKKACHILEINRMTGGDWEQTCLIILARGIGFGVNGDPFELLAKSLPLKILHHHSDNILQIEALFFGQAGMLDSSIHIFDEYYQAMCSEYYFLARKYGLRPLRNGIWKYSRTRPQNFPHRRIALLAKACENGFSLFSNIISSGNNEEELKKLFGWKLEGYWNSHFSFDTEARGASEGLSETSLTLLIINVIVPLIYAYASKIGELERAEKAFNILSSLTPENNIIVRQWRSLGLPVKDAQQSQAVIELKKSYCDPRKCLYCRFGHYILSESSHC